MDKLINPLTGRMIKINGTTHNRLLEDGILFKAENIDISNTSMIYNNYPILIYNGLSYIIIKDNNGGLSIEKHKQIYTNSDVNANYKIFNGNLLNSNNDEIIFEDVVRFHGDKHTILFITHDNLLYIYGNLFIGNKPILLASNVSECYFLKDYSIMYRKLNGEYWLRQSFAPAEFITDNKLYISGNNNLVVFNDKDICINDCILENVLVDEYKVFQLTTPHGYNLFVLMSNGYLLRITTNYVDSICKNNDMYVISDEEFVPYNVNDITYTIDSNIPIIQVIKIK